MYLRKQNVFTEQRIFPYLTDSDLAFDRMGKFRRRAYAKHADHPWKQMSDREILKSMRLYAMDYASGEEGYTLAAALLMGRDDVIASVCPAYKTDVIIRIDNTERYDDRLCTSTNLIDAHMQICKFISAYLPDRFHLEQGQAISPRDIIVREVVTNSLIHREYISPRPARIIIDREKLVADNASRASFQGVSAHRTLFLREEPHDRKVLQPDRLGRGARVRSANRSLDTRKRIPEPTPCSQRATCSRLLYRCHCQKWENP